MLTKTLTSELVAETTARGVEASVGRRTFRPRFAALAQFFAIVAQFALIVMLVDYWQLESHLLSRVLWLALGGFIIHHLLPQRFRLPFFAGLSLVAVITAVGHIGPNEGRAWLTGPPPAHPGRPAMPGCLVGSPTWVQGPAQRARQRA
jgi:hypothetical protein